MSIPKWSDNKSVEICATHCTTEVAEHFMRRDSKNKKLIDISCPTVIKDYNKLMVGVDFDSIISH